VIARSVYATLRVARASRAVEMHTKLGIGSALRAISRAASESSG
jgi:hypothetical protein